eukprot:4899566-Pleurochrysis_carterae.AAC.2
MSHTRHERSLSSDTLLITVRHCARRLQPRVEPFELLHRRGGQCEQFGRAARVRAQGRCWRARERA